MKKSFIKSLINTLINNVGKENVRTVMYKKENEEIVLEVLNELGITPDLFVHEGYACFVSDKKYYNEHITVEEYEEIIAEWQEQDMQETLRRLEEEEQDEYRPFPRYATKLNDYEFERAY